MMKTLLLLRHGKSDWDAEHESDHERPLARRGIKAAKKIGRYVKAIDEVPEFILSSTAERAFRTAALASKSGNWGVDIQASGDLYEASASDLLRVIQSLDDQFSVVMLVGHEPTWSAAIAMLTGASVRFPTGALARVDFQRSAWKAIGPNTGHLSWLVVPRSLPDKT